MNLYCSPTVMLISPSSISPACIDSYLIFSPKIPTLLTITHSQMAALILSPLSFIVIWVLVIIYVKVFLQCNENWRMSTTSFFTDQVLSCAIRSHIFDSSGTGGALLQNIHSIITWNLKLFLFLISLFYFVVALVLLFDHSQCPVLC